MACILSWKVGAFLYTNCGNKNQKIIININHNTELIKKALGDTRLKKNNPADTIAKTFTSIIIIFISRRVIKWYRSACITFGLL
jgi:hypothetical protein